MTRDLFLYPVSWPIIFLGRRKRLGMTEEEKAEEPSPTQVNVYKSPAQDSDCTTGIQMSAPGVTDEKLAVVPYVFTRMATGIKHIDRFLVPVFDGNSFFRRVGRAILGVSYYTVHWLAFVEIFATDHEANASTVVVTARRITGLVFLMALYFLLVINVTGVRSACLYFQHHSVTRAANVVMVAPPPAVAVDGPPGSLDNTDVPAGSVPPAVADDADAQTSHIIADDSTATMMKTTAMTTETMTASPPPLHLFVVDEEVCYVSARWAAMVILMFLPSVVFETEKKKFWEQLTLFGSTTTAFKWLLPRAIKRWVPPQDQARARKFLPLFSRTALGIILCGLVPGILLPISMKMLNADQVSLLFPLVLSFVEFLVVRFLINDRVCEGHSPEAISVMGRMWVTAFESYRVGVLVLLVNTSGTLGGMVTSVMFNAFVEGLARNGLFMMASRFCKDLVNYLAWSGPGASVAAGAGETNTGASPPPTPAFPKLSPRLHTFNRVYLGCKYVAEEYTPVYALALIRLTAYGFPEDPALVKDTARLKPELRCGWDALAVITAGAILSDVLTWVIHSIVLRTASSLAVDTPVIWAGRSVVFHTILWGLMAFMSIFGICSIGALAEEIADHDNDGGG